MASQSVQVIRIQVVGPRNCLSIPGMGKKKMLLPEASRVSVGSAQPVMKQIFLTHYVPKLNSVDFVYRPTSSLPRLSKT